MGTAIGARLAEAGFSVHGHDVDAQKRVAYTSTPATVHDSLESLARSAEVLILAVFDAAQVETVVNAVIALNRGPIPILCTSTCPPAPLERLAVTCANAGVQFIECPVSGTSLQVRKGDALGMLAGDKSAIESVRTVIEAFCPRWRHVGPIGAGAKTKLAVNLVLGLNRAAMAEGLSFAQAIGVEPVNMLSVLKESAAYSQVMDVKGMMMTTRRFNAPQSRVDQSLKDFKLMRAEAATVGRTLPFATKYIELLEQLLAAGHGAIDNAAIIEAIDKC